MRPLELDHFPRFPLFFSLGADNTPVAVFSVLVNDIPKNVAIRNAKTLHERVALAIEEFIDGDSLTADVIR